MNKKHKKKGKVKSRNSSKKRSKSLSKNSKETKSVHTSRKSSFTTGNESANAGDNSVRDLKSDSQVGRNISTLTKPQKLEKASMSMWSEPSRCCVCCIDKSTVQPCTCNEVNNAFPQFIEEQLDKNRTEDQTTVCIGLLTKERDHYKAEFERLLELFEKLNDSTRDQDRNRLQCKACDKKDQMIEYFQRENQILAKEKYLLMTRLEESDNKFDMQSPGGTCQKLPCKRIERERDMLKFDVQRLEEENDCLREKIKATNENKTREYVKFQEYRIEYENTISKLDGERRELIKAQGMRRITINALEEKLQTYCDLLRVEQDETQRMKNQYLQLKKLHDQCDKALLDTQAQLLEVETELLNCQNKKSSANKKEGSHQFPGVDEIIETTPEQRKMGQLASAKRKTEEQVLEEQNKKLKNELSEKEKELNLWKEKCKNSEMVLVEKTTEIKNFQNENSDKMSQLKDLQSTLEERDSASRVLRAEVEHLNKEINALINTNHKHQGDIQQYKVQVSVAMETISDLENKVKTLERTNTDYEKQIRMMKIDLARFESQTAIKDREMDQLLQCKLCLEKTKEQLDLETEEHKKRICRLECQCQKLKMTLMTEASKDNLISDLNSKLAEMKAGRDQLERENAELAKKTTIMENKLFQCICTICDNAQDKCTMLRCFLNEHENFKSRGGTFVNVTVSGGGTRDAATQVCICEGRCKKSKGSTNSKMLDMAPVDKSISKDDNTIYSTYAAAGPSAPFYVKEQPGLIEEKTLYKNPLNFDETMSMVNDKMLSSVPELQTSFINSSPHYPSEIVKEFVTDDYVTAYKLSQKGNGEKVSRND